jgi:PAS domain S-box-containing protein
MDISHKKKIEEIGFGSNDTAAANILEKLKEIVSKAAETTGASASLLVVKEQSEQRLIHIHGKDDKLIQAMKELVKKLDRSKGLTVIKNLADHQDLASELSQAERKRINFFACVPISNQNNESGGFLCVCDSEINELTDSQKDHLRTLAEHAKTLLQLCQKDDDLNKQQQKLNRYSTLLNNSADVTFTLDPDTGRIKRANHAMEKILGYESDSLNGTLFQELVLSDKITGVPVDSWFESVRKKNGRYKLQVNFLDSDENEICMSCNFTKEEDNWYVSASDISDQIEAENRASELKEKFKKTVRVATDLIYELDWETGELFWGDELTTVLGYPNTERYVDYDWWLDKIHPEDLQKVITDVDETLESERKKMKLVYRIRTYDGSYKYVMNRNYVDRKEDGTPSNIIGAIVDISGLVKSEERSDRNKKLLESLAENTWEATWVRDKEGVFLFSNEKYKELFNVAGKDVTGSKLEEIFDEKMAEKIRQRDKQVFDSGDPIVFEESFESDGELRHYKVHQFPMYDIPGLDDVAGGIAVDITNEKKNQEMIEESLEEKETLLMEIHHRVKNNLAVVSGMMQLQAMKETDEKIQEKLFASTSRIKTMSTIHELLYKSASFSDLKLADDIELLIERITKTYNASVDLETTFDLEPVELNINQAVPCSLIVNEVITNVLKHAYDDGDKGTLTIVLKEDNGSVELVINDDGRGLPDNFDEYEHNGTLGLELIKILTSQLDGTYTYKNLEKGAQFKLTFEKTKIKGGKSFMS